MERELRLVRPNASRAYFGPRAAMVCSQGAGRLLEIPRSNREIFAVVSKTDTGPDCFEISDNGKSWAYLAIRLVDHDRTPLDVDFAKWLRAGIKNGYKYLRFEFDA